MPFKMGVGRSYNSIALCLQVWDPQRTRNFFKNESLVYEEYSKVCMKYT